MDEAIEAVGVMSINNRVVVVYNRNREVLFKADGWDLDADGNLIQTKPMSLAEYPPLVPTVMA